MFRESIALFDEYYRRMYSRMVEGFNRALGCEARRRLVQLEFILERVKLLENLATQTFARHDQAFMKCVQGIIERGIEPKDAVLPEDVQITPEELALYDRAEFEMELLTESFYYLAGRLRTIIRHPSEPLPGLRGFECRSIRDVRNKLLEHAEGRDSQVYTQSFGWGGAQGPVLKSIREAGLETVFPDRGLYENARELQDSLKRVLGNAISQRGDSTTEP